MNKKAARWPKNIKVKEHFTETFGTLIAWNDDYEACRFAYNSLKEAFKDPLMSEIDESLRNAGLKNEDVIVTIYSLQELEKKGRDLSDPSLKNLKEFSITAFTVLHTGTFFESRKNPSEKKEVPQIWIAVRDDFEDFCSPARMKAMVISTFWHELFHAICRIIGHKNIPDKEIFDRVTDRLGLKDVFGAETIDDVLNLPVTKFGIIWDEIADTELFDELIDVMGPLSLEYIKTEKGWIYGSFTHKWLVEESIYYDYYFPDLIAMYIAGDRCTREDLKLEFEESKKYLEITVKWKPRKKLEEITIKEAIEKLNEEYKRIREEAEKILDEFRKTLEKEGFSEDEGRDDGVCEDTSEV